MPGPITMFGPELRRRRIRAGLSLTTLASLVHYSKGYLSKIETGRKPAPADLARRCDAALDAGGELAALVPNTLSEAPLPQGSDDSEVWMMTMAQNGSSWFRPMTRRDAMAMGATSTFGLKIGIQGLAETARENAAQEILRTQFDYFRRLGQAAAPSVVLPALIAHAHTVRELAAQASGADRDRLLKLGARICEYAGWMAQESGSEDGALWWTDRAVEMAAAGNDPYLAAYSLVRRALVAFYRGDAARTISLARQAQAANVPRRITGLAAQREAQGHALAGDYDACLRGLDRARELLAEPDHEQSQPVLGPTNLADPVAMVTGWCLHDLGRPRAAAEIMDREVPRIPAHALRSRARYGVRRALAHAAANEIEHACQLTTDVLGMTEVVSSATITSDLRRLANTLVRFHARPSVQELYPRLTAALRVPAV